MYKMLNYKNAVQIAPKVWWVGYVIPNDPFQCHVYLIENGNESIIIDPGSKITWEVTRKKILEIMPLENIKYIVCQHQDPDITAAVEDLLAEIGTKDRFVVTHWRTAELLKHYKWGIEFYEIDKNNWRLTVSDIELEFVFTPYMHFAGAFCTYCKKEKILFSSDIFGAFTDNFKLYADDAKTYFEQMKPFMMHYMSSSTIVNHGIDNIEKKDINLIAPQHGSIITKEMISYILKKMRELNVGLYLNFNCYGDVKKILRAYEITSKMYEKLMFSENDSCGETKEFMLMANELFDIKRIIFLTKIDNEIVLYDTLLNDLRELEWDKNEYFSIIEELLSQRDKISTLSKIGKADLHSKYLSYSFLKYDEFGAINGACFLLFSNSEELKKVDMEILNRFEKIFNILLAKVKNHFKTQKIKKNLEHKVITDALTNLYNRYFLKNFGNKEIEKVKRYRYPLSIAMIDLDNFKHINDNYGHDVGDLVLKDFSKILKESLRKSDTIFRYGGEEFLIFMPFTSKKDAKRALNKIKDILHNKSIMLDLDKKIEYTFSAGIVEYNFEYSLENLIKKADNRMYKAKQNGKDRIELES